ncbi:GNAT family N-acetyltransferase [Microbacterium suaedae]|uniref:GNAT family N-acetyltransferase n=1 Tax=Microbacterium suaedae TaxID=2067813 RepID=UPI000DA24D1D|nr:GNAT family N-acetyltransferase [Microbacterium suaedae]
MKHHSIEVIAHKEITETDLGELRRLFDSEYLEDFGEWDQEQPYGYAPHDAHVMARIDDRVVGHVGWTRREIAVGTETVAIAGVGGVLVCDEARGQRLGVDLMELAARSMRDHGGVSFGYLGCREQVVPFYLSCGWARIVASERSIGRDGEPVVDEPGQPILIRPITTSLELWPEGDIDLRGRAW